MATTDQFTYTFSDGKTIKMKRFDKLPFKALRELHRATKGDGEDMVMAMFDLMETAMTKKDFEIVENQTIDEATSLLEAWQTASEPTEAGETEGE